MMTDPSIPPLLIRLKDFFENVKSDFALLVKYYESLIPDRPVVFSKILASWSNLSPFLDRLIEDMTNTNLGEFTRRLENADLSAKLDFELAIYEMRRDDFYNLFYENIRKNTFYQNRGVILEKFKDLLEVMQNIKNTLEANGMPLDALGVALQQLKDDSGMLI
jgi:hypothetical protein